MMSFVINGFSFIWQSLLALCPFVVLLGVLVFIHELGHFLVARWLGVRVEVFSLGFGKKILKWKRNHTVYCVSMIPLGGYVKMFGHSFDPENIPKEDQAFSFLHQPLSSRIAIVLAGPLMNLLLAIIILMGMFMVGQKRMHPVVGEVEGSSFAEESGFELDDQILSVWVSDSDSSLSYQPKHWEEFRSIILKHSGQRLSIQVKKSSNEIQTLDVVSNLGGVIKGLSPLIKSAVIGVDDPHSLAGRSGLQTFDTVLSVNGKVVRNWSDLKKLIVCCLKTNSWTIRFQREKLIKTTQIKISKKIQTTQSLSSQSVDNFLKTIGIRPPDLFISDLRKTGSAYQMGLRKKDFVLSVNGQVMNRWSDLVTLTSRFNPKNGPLDIQIIRQGQIKTFSILPKSSRVMKGMVEETRYMLGIVSGASYYKTTPAGGFWRERTFNPVKAFWMAIKKTSNWCVITGVYFKKLITGEVSKKTLGGVIAIGQAAYRSYSLGLEYFFEIMAVLSIQLFLLNILPLPILDGGHLFFYVIEYLRGKPVSMKNMLIAHYVGFFLLLSLMVFVTFNDLDRWINIW